MEYIKYINTRDVYLYSYLFGVRLHGIDRRELKKIQDSPYCGYRFKYLRK